MLNTIVTFVRRAALAAALAATSGFAAAGTIHVSIDTSVFDTDSGYLDFALSSTTGVPLATATISNLTGFGKATRDESVSFGFGDDGASYVLRNDEPNYLSHVVDFGGELAFDLTFAGDFDEDTAYLSHFAVWLLDSDFQPLGSTNSSNFAMLEYRWTPSATEGGQGSVGTVPEPGVLLLMGAGVAGMLVARRRRAIKQAA